MKAEINICQHQYVPAEWCAISLILAVPDVHVWSNRFPSVSCYTGKATDKATTTTTTIPEKRGVKYIRLRKTAEKLEIQLGGFHSYTGQEW